MRLNQFGPSVINAGANSAPLQIIKSGIINVGERTPCRCRSVLNFHPGNLSPVLLARQQSELDSGPSPSCMIYGFPRQDDGRTTVSNQFDERTSTGHRLPSKLSRDYCSGGGVGVEFFML